MKRDWRCTHCDKLLGVLEGARLHIRFARGHEYIVGFPATNVCRRQRAEGAIRRFEAEQR